MNIVEWKMRRDRRVKPGTPVALEDVARTLTNPTTGRGRVTGNAKYRMVEHGDDTPERDTRCIADPPPPPDRVISITRNFGDRKVQVRVPPPAKARKPKKARDDRRRYLGSLYGRIYDERTDTWILP